MAATQSDELYFVFALPVAACHAPNCPLPYLLIQLHTGKAGSWFSISP